MIDCLPRIRHKCRKGMRSETSIYPELEVIPEIIGSGALEDTRTASAVEHNVWREQAIY